MGRPKKVVPKTKKIKLTKEQQSYAKLIGDVEKHLAEKTPLIEALDVKITKLAADYNEAVKKLKDKRDALIGEKRNLEAAKKNLEGVLAQIPPPKEWETYTKYIYEYHYHYHNCGCPSRPCLHFPIVQNQWWGGTTAGATSTTRRVVKSTRETRLQVLR